MYVRATTIEGRHGRLPGGIEIAWQGAGMDRGNTIVQKDGRWYLTRDLAGSVALHGSVGGETLDGTVLYPVYGYPDTWWTDGTWSAYATGDPELDAWTIVHTPLVGWFPRQWLFPYLAPADQGTTDPEDVGTAVHGDRWFRNGLPRGYYLWRYPSASVDGAYAAPVMWEHAGKGTAPAGEYSNGTPVAGPTVGYWNEEEGLYELGERGEDATVCSVGIVRTEPASETPDPGQLMWGWDFQGADWTHPDPMDWRYWWCVRCAILEREGALYQGSAGYGMGGMIAGESLLNVSPWSPPSLGSVRAFREAIRALAAVYVDFSKVLALLRAGDPPAPDRTRIDLAGYRYLAGGWTQGDTVASDTPCDLLGFLREAHDALVSMVVLVAPRSSLERVHEPTGYGYATDAGGGGGSFSAAMATAVDDFRDHEEMFKPEIWSNWQAGHPYPDYLWSMPTGCYGIFSTEEDEWGDHAWEAQYDVGRRELTALCFPPTSVLDGGAMAAPTVLWARRSEKSTSLEVGDTFRNGIVTGVAYHSDFALEGVTHGTATLPYVLSEEPFVAVEPETPTTPGYEHLPGYRLVGNSTITWVYVFWGGSFRFGGPLPDLDQDESEENQNE